MRINSTPVKISGYTTNISVHQEKWLYCILLKVFTKSSPEMHSVQDAFQVMIKGIGMIEGIA